jgi:23S rRNA (cytidine1920-2'-O)/16S rRNA (cytidine1409-2'-O)-methyltransferase
LAERLDIELVLRSLARSRSHAAQLIDQSRVLVAGKVCSKASQKVEPETKIELSGGPDFVSRAGQKLDVALTEFGIPVSGWCLDAGASTGGFTQVLLERGAKGVYSVDVGHDQLAAELRSDPRVKNLEGLNLRELTRASLSELSGVSEPIDLVVADLSFISLTLVMDNLSEIAPKAPQILLIKPQFEVGKHSLNASGIVTDWRDRRRALEQVVNHAAQLGYEIKGLRQSSILGTHGNTEYLLWITPTGLDNREQWLEEIVSLAKKEK